MPYHQDRHAEYIDPLKLYDYFAAGLPVASLNIPAARAFKKDLHMAGNPDEFEKAIESALADMSPERRQARRMTASRHTWESRVERLSEIMQTILREKAEHRTGPLPKT
jgi:glycosyltransferase involved in cell wall biosynthesis